MGPQGPLARTTSTAADARYYLYDGLGSVVGEADVNGVVQAAKKYDVYGAARATTGTAKSRQGWVGGLGHQTDPETGYTYMRARYYDSTTGRFASEDPKGDGNNWFAYCGNNPVNYSDFNGQEKGLSTGISIVGLLMLGGQIAAMLGIAAKNAAFATYLKAWAASLGAGLAMELLEKITNHHPQTAGIGAAGLAVVGLLIGLATPDKGKPGKDSTGADLRTNVTEFWQGYMLTLTVTAVLLFAEDQLFYK